MEAAAAPAAPTPGQRFGDGARAPAVLEAFTTGCPPRPAPLSELEHAHGTPRTGHSTRRHDGRRGAADPMTAAAVTPLARRSTPVAAAPPPEDRWQRPSAARARRFTTATAVVLLGSVLGHGAFVATAFLPEARSRFPASEEIPVELVQEQPPEPPKEASKEGSKEASLEAPKSDASQAAPPPPAAKPDEAPKETSKEAPKEVAKEAIKAADAVPPREEPKPALPPEKADARQAATPPVSPEPQKQAPAADQAAELKSLQDELASLKAEHAALQADAAESSAPAALQGLGPLPASFQAAALPSETSGEGDVVGYAALVFSRLAKAKELGGRLGEPGSAGVQFAIDERGLLASVKLVASSGVKALDDEAVAIVRKAAPFPVPPEGAQRSFSANVNFVGAAR